VLLSTVERFEWLWSVRGRPAPLRRILLADGYLVSSVRRRCGGQPA